jgi:hypothetical protein
MRGRALLHGGQALHEALRRARAVQRGALGQQLAPARAPPAFATSERAPAPLALRPPGWPPPCAAAGHAPGRSACARAAPQHRRTAQTRRCARRRATHGLLTTAAPSLHWSAGYLALHSHNPDSRPAAPGGARGAPEHDWQAALGAINGGASRDARVVQVQGGGRRGRGRCGTQHARRHARPAAAAAVAVLRPRQQALPRRAVPGQVRLTLPIC